MKTYGLNVPDRKTVVKRIVELTGEPSHYTKMPRCAFEIGIFTIERDGTLVVEDGEGEDVIRTLAGEGLIKADGADTDELGETSEAEDDETTEGNTDEAIDEDGDAQAENEPEIDGLTIELPLVGHTGVSLKNLIFMLYSRGKLLSKATGGEFRVEEDLAEALKEDAAFESVDSVRQTIAEHGESICGLEITDERVRFTGFPAPTDADYTKAFTQLAALMNKMALTQKRTQAKEVDDSNERYAFRIWLLRLGMAGNEYKRTRNILMQPLSGHTAFKTQEEADRFKARMKAKRDAEKASEAAEEDR